MPVLGEGARIEFRIDAYNVFNNLNLNRAASPTTLPTQTSARFRMRYLAVSSWWGLASTS